MKPNKLPLIKEAFALWALVISITSLVFHVQNLNPILNYLSLLPPLLLLYSPLLLHSKKQEKVDYFEKSLHHCLKSILTFLIVSILIFPALFIANHFFQKFIYHRHYYPISVPLLDYIQYLFFHLMMVALPEEVFFRAYFLTRLQAYFNDSKNILGVKVGLGFLITSLVFAFSHSIVLLEWWHFAIFFPALVFAYLRLKTQGILAPILFHASSNLFAYWIVQHYR